MTKKRAIEEIDTNIAQLNALVVLLNDISTEEQFIKVLGDVELINMLTGVDYLLVNLKRLANRIRMV